jgi:hypothetical protein
MAEGLRAAYPLEPVYPLVPTRAQVSGMSLNRAEERFLACLVKERLKGLPIGRLGLLAQATGLTPAELDEMLATLHAKRVLCWDETEAPRHAYLGEVLLGSQSSIMYTYHAETRARLKIMWEQALSRADAAGEPVEWTGRPNGIDESIPVPEITARVNELHAPRRQDPGTP